ncbi:MAG TPA: hypothetical protein VK789_34945 [Bryobacteraceae bacterium]|jgi:hypothetical protein|nr:hypothetical protein [Bryobacteraceae bacterium]
MAHNRSESTGLAFVFYWVGILMSIGCLSLVFTGNTETVWRFEHIGIPLSWVVGGCAILALVAFEYLESSAPARPSAFLEFSVEPAARQAELS